MELSKKFMEEILERVSIDICDYDDYSIQDFINECYQYDYAIIGTAKAKELIKKYIDDYFNFVDFYKNEFGDINFLDDYEKVINIMFAMAIEDTIFNKININPEEQITDELIKKIDNFLSNLIEEE